ncbi:MAG: hypothetical protein Q8N84_03560 [bacterium]|nr:hypothetical protein [bacterium]
MPAPDQIIAGSFRSSRLPSSGNVSFATGVVLAAVFGLLSGSLLGFLAVRLLS